MVPSKSIEPPESKTMASKVLKAVRQRLTMAAFKRHLRIVRYRLKIQLLFYSTVYLVRHWFDFFCHPWTFDYILFIKRVPSLPTLVIFSGAIAWAWKYQTPANFRSLCVIVLIAIGMEFYIHHNFQHFVEAQTSSVFSTSICSCAAVVFAAVFGNFQLEPKDLDTKDEDLLRQDRGAIGEHKDLRARDGRIAYSNGQSHAQAWSNWRALLGELPSIRAALALALIAVIATMRVHPPQLATELLSTMNCKAHSTQLDYDGQLFEFTTTDQNNTFTGRCTEAQQLLVLEGIMNAHIANSSATCGVFCPRIDASGKWVGYISQVTFGLPDMYHCRGGYGSFGPDCEVEGEEYGYDTSREGWMDDIYEPWS